MIAKLRKQWRELKTSPAGERFQELHERQKSAPGWVKPVLIFSGLGAFAIAIVLSVLPGPAFVFYGIAGALLAVESAWFARVLDRFELFLRKLKTRMRSRTKRASSTS